MDNSQIDRVCRMCFEITNSYILIGDRDMEDADKMLYRDKIQYCVPELDLYTDENAIICRQCHLLIRRFYKLKLKCIETEDSIRKYMTKYRIDDSRFVKIERVKEFHDDENKFSIVSVTPEVTLPSTNNNVVLIEPPQMVYVKPKEGAAKLESSRKLVPVQKNLTIIEVPTNMYKCLTCCFETYNPDTFQTHECLESPTENNASQMNNNNPGGISVPQLTTKSKETDVKTITMKTGEWYLCNQCSFRTIDLNILKCHNRTIHKIYENTVHRCNVKACRYRTDNNILFHKHMDRHHQNKVQIECPDCSFTTFERRAYRNHRDKEHLPVKCTICNYNCGTPYVYKFHMRTTHPNVKLIDC